MYKLYLSTLQTIFSGKAPPDNQFETKVLWPDWFSTQCLIFDWKICWCEHKTYLFNWQNTFVKIIKCICPDKKIYFKRRLQPGAGVSIWASLLLRLVMVVEALLVESNVNESAAAAPRDFTPLFPLVLPFFLLCTLFLVTFSSRFSFQVDCVAG